MITVVGVGGDDADDALKQADVLVGSDRLLAATRSSTRPEIPTVRITGDIGPALDAIDAAVGRGEHVCVVAAGDPGWFGIVRALAQRFGRDALRVVPAPSSVSEAFARLAMPWDDAVVVSAHGRPLADAARLVARAPKAAVLTSPEAAPEAVGAHLIDLGATHEHVAVCSLLGTRSETVTLTDLGGLARGTWDPLSVVIVWSGTGVAVAKSLAFGTPEVQFAHRASMVTKAEVRAVVIGLMALPGPSVPAPVVWDIGTGSGSVIVECARLAPWIEAIAVDGDADAVATCAANARTHGVAVRSVAGSAPECLRSLPDPDRIFVGGGGIEVLEAARRRLRPDGVVVATYAAIDRAAVAATLLGNLTQISSSRGRLLPDGSWRLDANNPVFVTWGSSP